MFECARQAADDLESAGLPKVKGACVRRDDEIELRRAETAPARFVERMHAKRAPNPLSPRFWQRHVTAICDMCTRTTGVGLEIVGTDDPSVRLSHEYRMRRLPPIGQRRLARDIARLRIGLTGAERRLQNCPDGIVVVTCRSANLN